MRKYVFILGSAVMLLMASCSSSMYSTQDRTKGEVYKNLYQESPTSIVVMPPINKSSNVDAKQYFYTTLYKPLCERGYYVFSPQLMMDMFQGESAYDSELFIDGNLKKFKDVIGADAAMFTIIKSWEKVHLANMIRVDVEFILKSTTTNKILYQRGGDVTIDLSVDSGGDDGLSALFDLVATAVNTAVTDQVVAGRKCTEYVLRDMPAGKYSPEHGLDATEKAGVSHISELTL